MPYAFASTMEKRVPSTRPASPRDNSPPSKRPFLGNSQNISSVNMAIISNSMNTHLNEAGKVDVGKPETLEAYQKEAVLRRMHEYKREADRLGRLKEKLENNQDMLHDHLGLINKYWDQLLSDLRLIIMRADHDGSLSKITLNSARIRESNFLVRLNQSDELSSEHLKQEIKQKCLFTREVVKTLLEKIIVWFEERNSFIKFLQVEQEPAIRENRILKVLKKEYEEINRINADQEKQLEILKADYSSLYDEVTTLRNQLQKTKNLLEATQEKLDDTKSELEKAEKRFDRSRCPTLGFWHHDVTSSTETISQIDRVESPERSSIVDNEVDRLYEARGKEMERQKDEIIKLKQELEDYRIKYQSIPEHRITESHTYKLLDTECKQLKDKVEHYNCIIESLTRDLEDMKANRRAFQEQVEKEANQRILEITKEMHMIEADLNRVRALRDAAIHEADIAKARNSPGFQQIPALRRLANGRKSQLRRIMDEIRLENARAAYECRDMESFEYYTIEKEPNDDTDVIELKYNMSLVADLRGKLRQAFLLNRKAEEQNIELRIKLEAYKDAPQEIKQTQELLVSKRNLRKEIDILKRRLDEYDEKYGIRDPGDDPLHILSAKIEEKDKRITELVHEVAVIKHREMTQVREITELDKAMQQLDEKANQQMFDIIKHENELLRLAEMKSKAEQKCQALTNKFASIEQQNKDYAALRLKMEETIRQQDYQIKNLHQQLANLEKETATAVTVIQTHKLKLTECMQDNGALREKLTKYENKYNDLVYQYKEKIGAIENEVYLKRKAQEEMSVYKKRLEDLQLRQSSGGSKAAGSELEQIYKDMVKCRVCCDRLIDTCIVKCGHVFCAECVNARIETRQRKCGKCGEAFGTNDVKRLYI
ncbi:hypothetical protein G9A89_021902 [Geosiphon pyriformis]|nr:hypothetical protein G9A89_021902 [Geosiphon pyriformis]